MTWGTESRHKRGYGNAWEKLRIRILGRDKYLCQPCKRRALLTTASQVDHIVSKSQGGTDDPSNLQAICTVCHKAKTQAESRGRQYIETGCNELGIPNDRGHHWLG